MTRYHEPDKYTLEFSCVSGTWKYPHHCVLTDRYGRCVASAWGKTRARAFANVRASIVRDSKAALAYLDLIKETETEPK